MLERRKTLTYAEGSVIAYRAFGNGPLRYTLVDEKSDDIKNGRPGFGGVLVDRTTLKPLSDDDGVWGYDYDIVRVVRK